MNLIDLARQLGEEIQNDEMYVKVRMAEQKLETDEEFQKLMSSFNEEKTKLNEEIMKENSDKEKIHQLNTSIEEKYDEINNNPNMISYREVQKDFMDIIKKINTIILMSAQGQDPYADDYYECGGSCSSCDGCH